MILPLAAVGIAESGLDQPFDYGKQLGRPRATEPSLVADEMERYGVRPL